MKILAGLGSIDDLHAYAEAGADEVFAGYIPGWWIRKYGMYSPLNRREVLYYNVQIGSQSEMEILHLLAEQLHIKVTITLNALYYLPEQYPLLYTYVKECIALGFNSFIIADPALLVYLAGSDVWNCITVSLSGEFGEMNQETIQMLAETGIDRIIFHRKMTICEMKQCRHSGIHEYEAFVLNENCHFHGGYCSSLHCDELTHSCHLPYRLMNMQKEEIQLKQKTPAEGYLTGESGCGLCALWDLREAGITHLKVVGRGNYAECMTADIHALKLALKILEDSSTKEEYIIRMKQELFPEGCSHACYYSETERPV